MCVTGANITDKHDERVFFTERQLPCLSIPRPVKEDYEDIIQDYQKLHAQEREPDKPRWESRMQSYKGHNPGETAFSRHVWNMEDKKLKHGDLVFARVNTNSQGEYEIIALFPVSISRKIYECSATDLLPESLHHTEKRQSLSPADRLFGWVAQKKTAEGKESAYKGRIRVEIDRSQKLETKEFSADLPLAILGEPKPSQGRFYVAKDPITCQAQVNGGNKAEKGFTKDKGLRGRKYYWHHKGLEAETSLGKKFWCPFTSNGKLQSKIGGRNLEYIRQGSDQSDISPRQDSQNRSIKSWVKPSQTFTFQVRLHNATKEELGALLWLLGLGKEHHFRLGYGKPLGFGSLNLRLADKLMAKGRTWVNEYYSSLFCESPNDELNENAQKELRSNFMKSMVKAYSSNNIQTSETNQNAQSQKIFNNTMAEQLKNVKVPSEANTSKSDVEVENEFLELPFIKGFLQVNKGPKKEYPIHYPRASIDPQAEGKNFEWFGNNEHFRSGQKLSLPMVVTDQEDSLPIEPTNE